MRLSLAAVASLATAACVLALPPAANVRAARRAPQGDTAPVSSSPAAPSTSSLPSSAPAPPPAASAAPRPGDSQWSALTSQLQSVNQDLSSWGGNGWNGSGWGGQPAGPYAPGSASAHDWSLSGPVTSTLTTSGPSGLETSTVTRTRPYSPHRPSDSYRSGTWSPGASWSHPSWSSGQGRSWASGASSLGSQAKSLYSQADAQTSSALSQLANSFSAQASALSALAGAATSTASSPAGSSATSDGAVPVQAVSGLGSAISAALFAAAVVWA